MFKLKFKSITEMYKKPIPGQYVDVAGTLNFVNTV